LAASCSRLFCCCDTLLVYLPAFCFFSIARICDASRRRRLGPRHGGWGGWEARGARRMGAKRVPLRPCTHLVGRHVVRVVEERRAAKAAAEDLDGVHAQPGARLHQRGRAGVRALLVQRDDHLCKGGGGGTGDGVVCVCGGGPWRSPWRRSSLLPCCLAALLPCCLAALLPCCLAALLPQLPCCRCQAKRHGRRAASRPSAQAPGSPGSCASRCGRRPL
jgi:hypothetical protein